MQLNCTLLPVDFNLITVMVHVNCNLTAVPGLGMLCVWGCPAGVGFRGVDFQSGPFYCSVGVDVETCSEIFGVKLICAEKSC